jgi:peptide/nickel transport system substrate-binding protein
LNNINVRKAIYADLNVKALQLLAGGQAAGSLATHLLPPELPGYQQAGGAAGPALGFDQHPTGDRALAEKYMRAAGYSSGRYTGGGSLTLLAETGQNVNQATTIAQNLKTLGFNVQVSALTPTAQSAACGTPARKIPMCLNGWDADFLEPATQLYVPFDGGQIKSSGNWNFAQLNVRAINKAMAAAQLITNTSVRAKAWGKIDDAIMAQAPVVPYLWRNNQLMRSANVTGMINPLTYGWRLDFMKVR